MKAVIPRQALEKMIEIRKHDLTPDFFNAMNTAGQPENRRIRCGTSERDRIKGINTPGDFNAGGSFDPYGATRELTELLNNPFEQFKLRKKFHRSYYYIYNSSVGYSVMRTKSFGRPTEFWRRVLSCSFFTLAVILLSTASRHAAAQELVDLHAHFFMPEAIGLSFLGNFDGPLRARTWSDRLKSRVNAEALEKSGVRIAVVALYSNPMFLGSQRDIIRRQIDDTQQFISTHPDWILARDSAQAETAIAHGKRVLILSIEGIAEIIENEDDIREFIDKWGVRIVTPIHFMDDYVGGAGFMPGLKILVNPWAAIKSLFSPHRDEIGVRVNPIGLTDTGRILIRSLLAHGVWIDLSHSSDASIREILPLLAEKGQRPLYTHTILRSAFRAERGISEEGINAVAKHGGIIGLLPSDDMLEGTQVLPQYCPAICHQECHGGIAAVSSQFHELSKTIAANHILFGTDIDAPVNFLQPGCPAAAEQTPQGIWNYSQLQTIYDALRQNGAMPDLPPDSMVKTFLAAWK